MTPICLITPPSVFLLDEKVFCALGILRVAACLEQAGHPVEMVDLCGVKNFEQAIGDHASVTEATIFGITATSPQMPATMKVAEAIRKAKPEAKIILGGPHPTLVGAALRRDSKLGRKARAYRDMEKLRKAFDVVVCGDGEEAVFVAIQPNSPPIVDVDDPACSMFLTNQRLNELPFPARHLVDLKSYKYSIDGAASTSAVFQLGCPYLCTFCSGRESPMLRRIRTRTTPSIIAELRELHDRYGYTSVMAFDDELNVNPKMIELMAAIDGLQKELGVEFKMRGFIKSQLFNDAQAEAMMKAGFRVILIGFESGSERILENIQKRATREDNTRCMEIARRHGLKVKALMSLGHAGESHETIEDTKQWLLEVKPDDFDATVITTYPGCPYFDHAEQQPDKPEIWTYTAPKSGDKLHAIDIDFTEVSGFYKGILGDYHSYVYTDFLTPENLVSLRDALEIDVRAKLGIPFNAGAPGIRYEASMGMTKLPPNILRSSLEHCA